MNKNIIDLTLTLSNQMKGVEIESAKTLAKDGWNASTLHLYSHVGTHMDAPMHFEINNQTIDKIPVQRLVSEAWVVNLTHIAPSSLLTVEDMESIADKIQEGQSLILHTGWSKKLYTDAYRNKLPRISKELANWMGDKGIGLLGVEPPSVADVHNIDEVTEIHTILMKNDIIILEGLANLHKISEEKITLIALPLKVENGDGAPARVLAME